MSKNAHILCVAAGRGPGRFAPRPGFTTATGTVTDMIAGDLWIGPRPRLETLRAAPDGRGPLSVFGAVVEAFGRDGTKDVGGMIDKATSLADMLSAGAGGGIDYPDFVQIIPYHLFRNNGRYLNYLRPDKGSETRLHGKVSIGIGGHVDLADVVVREDGGIDLASTLDRAGRREASEEIGASIDDQAFRYVSMLYATDTDVDRLHVGVVGICELNNEQAASLKVNDEISEHGFATLAEIKARADADPGRTLETWTRLIIESNPLA